MQIYLKKKHWFLFELFIALDNYAITHQISSGDSQNEKNAFLQDWRFRISRERIRKRIVDFGSCWRYNPYMECDMRWSCRAYLSQAIDNCIFLTAGVVIEKTWLCSPDVYWLHGKLCYIIVYGASIWTLEHGMDYKELFSQFTALSEEDKAAFLNCVTQQSVQKIDVTPDSVRRPCPFCGRKARSNGKTPSGRQRYFCPKCRKSFSNTTGTIFEHTLKERPVWESS